MLHSVLYVYEIQFDDDPHDKGSFFQQADLLSQNFKWSLVKRCIDNAKFSQLETWPEPNQQRFATPDWKESV